LLLLAANQIDMKTHKIAYIYVSACLLFISTTTQGQKIYIDENISYWYNTTSDLHIDHNVFVDENTIHLLLEINFNNQKIYDSYHYSYELHESYHTLDIRRTDTIDIKDHIVAIKANKIFVQLTLPYDDKIDIAIIRMTNKKTGIDYTYDIPLIKDYNFSSEGLVFYEQDSLTPHLQNFVGVNQRLMLKSVNPYPGPVYCFYYNHNFDEAVPPMVVEDQRAGKQLSIDSVFSISLNETISFSKEGLYFFQKDSSSANGIAIRVQDKFFPLAKTFDAVLDPLIYISTRTETEKIRSASNPRQAFEDYWIDMVKIPNLATSTVRQYYERVAAANYLFTTFEEGWKSDMGLIYIVYGPPNDVYKSEEIIDWVYNQDLSMPNIRFSFYKVKNVFTDHHYTLLRKKSYDKNWFKSVELWRDGKK
jgi:GWxTD domain-containing protein